MTKSCGQRCTKLGRVQTHDSGFRKKKYRGYFNTGWGLLGIIGDYLRIKIFPRDYTYKKIVYHKMQLLAKFQPNLMRRLEIIGQNVKFCPFYSDFNRNLAKIPSGI